MIFLGRMFDWFTKSSYSETGILALELLLDPAMLCHVITIIDFFLFLIAIMKEREAIPSVVPSSVIRKAAER